MQALSANKTNSSSESLLGECWHEQGADCEVLFIHAATAACTWCHGLNMHDFCLCYILLMGNWEMPKP